MKKHFQTQSILFLLLFLTGTGTQALAAPPCHPENPSKKASIQVALLLDTSNSMDGLIEQAKSQLWKILLELSKARKDQQIPQLEIALYEYGNDNLSESTGYIRQVNRFTSDMDKISEKLFALRTNGGNEYCGQVIATSLQELIWNTQQSDLRLIYIAGNEPFTQGSLPYEEACAKAKNKGVIVNTIFCGDYETGINGSWKAGALLTGGDYSHIDHNKATTYIPSPFDAAIEQLNLQLNQTYIAYGKQGKKYKENQVTQDANAAGYSRANAVDRAQFKASQSYTNSAWDLVDAYREDASVIKKKEALPEDLKHKTSAEIEAEIKKLMTARSAIQKEIKALSAKREAFLKKERKAEATEGTLEDSILNSLRKQAEEKGFEFEN